jgi:cobalt-precorrin 5A hydrolase
MSQKSVAKFASIKKEYDVPGLQELSSEMKVPVEYFDKIDLSAINIPNPSDVVQAFEGTSSVSEAAAIKGSGGELIVQKHKFPPNLTIAIARRSN